MGSEKKGTKLLRAFDFTKRIFNNSGVWSSAEFAHGGFQVRNGVDEGLQLAVTRLNALGRLRTGQFWRCCKAPALRGCSWRLLNASEQLRE